MKLWIPAFSCVVVCSIPSGCRDVPPTPVPPKAESKAPTEPVAAQPAGQSQPAAKGESASQGEKVAEVAPHHELEPNVRPDPFGGRKLSTPPDPAARDRAILDGLVWLARHQNEDGSWSPTTLAARCTSNPPCIEPTGKWKPFYDEGLTGLALLAFLERGSVNGSSGEISDPLLGQHYKIDDVVARGLGWLKARQQPDGSFTPDRAFMYNETIATLAMVAAYSATHSAEWKVCAQRGVDFIEAAQRPSPLGNGLWGWRYASRMAVEKNRPSEASRGQFEKELMDSDTSITGWCAETLRAARDAGLAVKDESLAGALAFTRWSTGQNGLVGYIDAKSAGATVTGINDHFVYHVAAMSALGMCTRFDTKPDPADPFLGLAAKRIAEDPPGASKDPLAIDYYYWHFGTLALRAYDGLNVPNRTDKYWGHWRSYVVTALLPLQDKSEKSCRQGGWITGDRWCYAGGPIYTTAINVLTLEEAAKQ